MMAAPLKKTANSRPDHGNTDLLDAVFNALGVGDPMCIECEESSNADSAVESPAKWVLSIEDDDDVAEALRLHVKQWGYEFVRAAQGTEGYRRAFMDAPAAILLDYELPEGNGDYVLRRLKETPGTKQIPVIVVTGRRQRNIEQQMKNLGASEFLTKPFDLKKLQAALEAGMSQAQTAEA